MRRNRWVERIQVSVKELARLEDGKKEARCGHEEGRFELLDEYENNIEKEILWLKKIVGEL